MNPTPMAAVAKRAAPWRSAQPLKRVPLPDALIDGAAVPGYEGLRAWGDEVSQPLLDTVAKKNEGIRAAAEAGGSNRSLLEADFLAISGGGDQGAFAAGVLSGWTKRGNRPEFEVVTGVSAGALAAPFAFVGSDHDGLLRNVYTEVGARDLYTSRGMRGFFPDALENNAPLRKTIEGYATNEFLDKIADGYRRGRRLFIQTTNLDAQRPVIWDLSAVAASDRPDRATMFAQILLASSAVPGLFPPVYFPVLAADGRMYTEMHVDGGVTAQLVFAPPEARVIEIEERIFGSRRKRSLYAIRNSKVCPEYQAAKPRALPIIARAVRTMIKYQVVSDLARLSRFSEQNNTSFYYCAVPGSLSMSAKGPFDKTLAQALFASGEEIGSKGLWSSAAPQSPSSERPLEPMAETAVALKTI